jgi:NIMA (never in mitosis gene a)-related kinase
MSPEVCSNERYSMASDIWSLGCLIYELCTLNPPFNARSHIELFNKIKVGKYPPLPPVYSAELQKVVASCLQTNPNLRPDTSHFLNLPIVCVMRKQHEAVQLHRELQHKMDDVDKMKCTLRNEIDASLRREWEVKARLEIDRRVEEEKQRLNGVFEVELDKRIAVILEQKERDQQISRRSSGQSLGGVTLSDTRTAGNSQLSSEEGGSLLLRVDRLYLESPAASQSMKRSNRTPLTRAHTTVAIPTAEVISPIDAHMIDPSPMSIASLALSPRKDGPGLTSTRVPANIFAAAEQGRQRWQPTNASALNSPSASDIDDLAHAFNDSDAEDIMLRSPSRDPAKKTTLTNRHKRISLAHPEKPGTRRLISAPSLGSTMQSTTISGLPTSSAQPKRPVSAVPVITTSPTRHRPGPDSPSRSNSRKLPSAAAALADVHDGGSPIRRVANSLSFRSRRDDSSIAAAGASTVANGGAGGMMKTAMRNQLNGVHGRTLVELAQARAGGVPRGDKLEKTKPAASDCAVWDPEQDEMPSPFLARGKRVLKSGFR